MNDCRCLYHGSTFRRFIAKRRRQERLRAARLIIQMLQDNRNKNRFKMSTPIRVFKMKGTVPVFVPNEFQLCMLMILLPVYVTVTVIRIQRFYRSYKAIREARMEIVQRQVDRALDLMVCMHVARLVSAYHDL